MNSMVGLRVPQHVLLYVSFVFFLAACGGPCQSGSEINMNTYSTDVPGKPPNFDVTKKSTYWTDAGFTIGTEDKPPAEVMGAVNLCGDTPAMPAYKEILLSWTNEQLGGVRRGQDTGMNVFVGDIIRMQAVDRIFQISDCAIPPNGVYVHDIDKCKNGFNFNGVDYPSYLGRDIKVPIAIDDFPSSPMDNIIIDARYRWVRGGKALIVPELYMYEQDGAMIQDEFPPLTTDEQCAINYYTGIVGDSEVAMKQYRCNGGFDVPGGESCAGHWQLNTSRVTAYSLNRYCDNIIDFTGETTCADWGGGSRPVEGDRLSQALSIMHDTCYTPMQIPSEDGAVDFNMVEARNLFFQRLNAIIRNTNGDVLENFPGPSPDPYFHSKDPLFFSANLGYNYRTTKAGRLWISIEHHSGSGEAWTEHGGFHVRVTRECPATNNLYLFISDKKDANGLYLPPDIAPGEDGSYKFPLSDDINTIPANIFLNGFSPPKAGRVYYGVSDNGDGYDNNVGSYNVTVQMPKIPNVLYSDVVAWVEEPVMSILYGDVIPGEDGARTGGIVNVIFERIVSSDEFQQILFLTTTLAVAIYSLFITAGLTQASSREVATLAIKAGIFFELLRPGSWEFFNTYLFDIFTNGMMGLIAILTTPIGQEVVMTDKLVFFDRTVTRFLSIETWLQMSSYLLAGPIGWIYFALYAWGTFCFLVALLAATLLYFTSLVMGGILISIAPLFFITGYFKFAGKTATSWFKVMGSCVLQPTFVFTGLAVINTAMEGVLDGLFGFGVCSKCAIMIDLGSQVARFCIANAPMPESVDNGVSIESRLAASSANTPAYGFLGLSVPMAQVLTYITLAYLMKSCVSVFGKMSISLMGVFGGLEGASVAHGVSQDIKYWFGQDAESRHSRMMAKVNAHGSGQMKGATVETGASKRGRGVDAPPARWGSGDGGAGGVGPYDGGGGAPGAPSGAGDAMRSRGAPEERSIDTIRPVAGGVLPGTSSPSRPGADGGQAVGQDGAVPPEPPGRAADGSAQPDGEAGPRLTGPEQSEGGRPKDGGELERGAERTGISEAQYIETHPDYEGAPSHEDYIKIPETQAPAPDDSGAGRRTEAQSPTTSDASSYDQDMISVPAQPSASGASESAPDHPDAAPTQSSDRSGGAGERSSGATQDTTIPRGGTTDRDDNE